MPMPHWKYRPYATVDLPDRTWPDSVVDAAPIWCSTDLRDGNQALVNPMDARASGGSSTLLLELGIHEIEVGFPSASKTDFDFVRAPHRGGPVPGATTTIAVLTQARPELIERTFEAIEGARRAIVHLYNSTSVDAAARRLPARPRRASPTWPSAGTSSAGSSRARPDGEIVFQYSPESFHHTELDYALEICEAVRRRGGRRPTRR